MAMAMTARHWQTISMRCCSPPASFNGWFKSTRRSRHWAIKVFLDLRQVGILPFEAGLKVLLRPQWACDHPAEVHEGWR